MVDYAVYIKSPKWQNKRLRMLQIQPTCQRCGSSRKLHVHHTNYDNLGSESREDLIVLCKMCHFGLHDDKVVIFCGASSSPFVKAQQEITESDYESRKQGGVI